MYSRTETADAVLKFYQAILRHPYLSDNALIMPPPDGWDNITIEGKNETVVNLLRHLPYLRSEKKIERLNVHYETIPICYPGKDTDEYIYPLPAHCVYLTRSVDHLGISLILDTNEGTLTEYTHSESHVTVSWEEYDALPDSEKWKGHYTAPIVEFLDAWTRRYEMLVWMLVPNPVRQPTTGRFYTRANSRPIEEELLHQGEPQPWHPEEDTASYDGESGFDKEHRKTRQRRTRHVADVYNMHLQHGWPDHFDKDKCRADLVELEKQKDAEDRRWMDETNPDKELFQWQHKSSEAA
ncbi:hypothetical protein BX600DRAFT_514813 [Xylariales sp. PMI_506]|nr:hypothetical protein BX600DRAFT_514813 [Xylariales sp. PMI_506]